MRFRSFLATLALAGAVACSDDNNPTGNNAVAPTSPAPDNVVASVVGPLTQPVTGTLQGGGRFVGNVTITSFARDAVGNLLVSGTLTGTARQGSVVTQITQNFTNIPATLVQQGQTCQILHLDIGPIFLDLLGLQVDLSRIILDITAVAGAGNLLGNLLCALVGILDQSPINLTLLDSLLAQINAILGSL